MTSYTSLIRLAEFKSLIFDEITGAIIHKGDLAGLVEAKNRKGNRLQELLEILGFGL